MKKLSICSLVVLIGGLLSSTVSAQIKFASTLDLPFVENNGSGQFLVNHIGPSNDINFMQAYQFRSGEKGKVSEVEVRVRTSYENLVEVGIFSDNGGIIGSLLESRMITVPSGSKEFDPVILPFSETYLEGDELFWIAMTTTEHAMGWYIKPEPTLLSGANNIDLSSGGWGDSPWSIDTTVAYEIRGTAFAVPEPSTYGMIGIGVLACLILVRRFRQ